MRRAPTARRSARALVAKRDAADADPVFGPLPLSPDVIQWHHDEITELPPGATLLASSPRYAHQAFRVGRHVYGLQFHIETTPEIVREPGRPSDPRRRRRPRPYDAEIVCARAERGARRRRRGLAAVRRPVRRRSSAAAAPPGGLSRWQPPRRPGDPAPGASSGWSGSASRTASAPPGCSADPALGLWDLDRNEPADPEAGAGRRRARPRRGPRPRRPVAQPAGRGAGPGRPRRRRRGGAARPAARLGAAARPAARRARRELRRWPTTSPRTPPTGPCWTTRTTGAGPAHGARRWSGSCSRAVGADPDDPPWGVRLGTAAPDASPGAIAALRLAYRRAVLVRRRPRPRRRAAAEDVAGELADLAGAVAAPPALARGRRRAARRRRRLPAGGHRRWASPAAASSTTSATSTWCSSAEPVDPSDAEARRPGQRDPRRRAT